MSKDRESGTINQGGASEPTREEGDREFAGNPKAKGEDPRPDDGDRGETESSEEEASTEEEAPIDLDAARDRAS